MISIFSYIFYRNYPVFINSAIENVTQNIKHSHNITSTNYKHIQFIQSLYQNMFEFNNFSMGTKLNHRTINNESTKFTPNTEIREITNDTEVSQVLNQSLSNFYNLDIDTIQSTYKTSKNQVEQQIDTVLFFKLIIELIFVFKNKVKISNNLNTLTLCLRMFNPYTVTSYI